nr:flagellar basal-body rod protein FlgF [Candidatus Calescibacterium sp.]
MIRGIYTALSGLNLHELKQSILANNIANIDTPGFKKDIFAIEGQDGAALFRFVSGRAPFFVGELPLSVQPQVSFTTDFSQGRLEATGSPFDLAISGEGFFVVETPNGPAYTRAGNCTRSVDGRLVTLDGYPLQGEAGDIVLPEEGELVVDEEGNVRVGGELVGKLRVVRFANPQLLEKVGGNLFRAPENVIPEEATGYTIHQGFLEKANMDIVEAMVRMIEALREYELAQRAVVAQDETLGKAVNEIPRLA